MTTSAADIKTAVEMLPADDIVDGVPKLEAVQRVAGDFTLTAADIAAALKPAESTKAETKPATPLLGEVQTASGAANDGAAHTVNPDDKEDGTGDGRPDLAVTRLAKAAAAKAELQRIQAQLDDQAKVRQEVDDATKALDKKRGQLEQVIEESTVQFSEADMVKKIQQQTQDRLMSQHEAKQKLAGVMEAAGVKTFASPLDQALALGNKRSIVIGADGKPFQAPHPRSPEGVRAYGNWVHHGAQRPA